MNTKPVRAISFYLTVVFAFFFSAFGAAKGWGFFLSVIVGMAPACVLLLSRVDWSEKPDKPYVVGGSGTDGKIPANVRRWTRRQLGLNIWGNIFGRKGK